jgi:hypothetical protein
MGTQRAGRRTWIMRDPREGTIRRILVLLEGRACETARAEAQLDLQQAHKQGTVTEYLQSLRRRGRGISECRDGHIERRRPIDKGAKPASAPRPGERMDGLVGLGSTVCTPVMGG